MRAAADVDSLPFLERYHTDDDDGNDDDDNDDDNNDGNDDDDDDDSTNANHVDGCHLVFQMVRIGIGWMWMMNVCTFREPDYILMAVAMMSDDDEIECDDDVQITIVTHSE